MLGQYATNDTEPADGSQQKDWRAMPCRPAQGLYDSRRDERPSPHLGPRLLGTPEQCIRHATCSRVVSRASISSGRRGKCDSLPTTELLAADRAKSETDAPQRRAHIGRRSAKRRLEAESIRQISTGNFDGGVRKKYHCFGWAMGERIRHSKTKMRS